MQIENGASGLLLMGSMGIQASIPDNAYVEAVKVAAEAATGRVPLFVGVMDNSIKRVMDRIEAIKDFAFDAVVLTTPYYFASLEHEAIQFFVAVADASPKPVFLYDLPSVTQCKITFDMVKKLAKHPNIVGIKSGDLLLAKQAKRELPEFEVLCSNLDCFDIAFAYGIDKVLDGMFSATPANGKKFVGAAISGDIEKASEYLDKILYLRDIYMVNNEMAVFSACMNWLGLEGNFAPDYMGVATEEEIKIAENAMKEIGEI